MAGWGFTADSEFQLEISEKLSNAADNYDSKVKDLYTEIDNMGTNWSGEDYNLFNSSTKAYKPAIDDLSAGFRMFSDHFEKMASGTETLATECIEIIMNMTGDSSGVYASVNGDTQVDDSSGVTSGNTNGTTNPDGTTSSGAAYGIGDPGTENESQTYVDHNFTEYFSSNSYWQNIGEDYSNNFNFGENASIIDYIGKGAIGVVATGVDAVQTVGNVAFDGTNDILEGAQWLLNGHWGGYESTTEVTNNPSGFTNPYNNAYWNNLGQDFAENYDFSDDNTLLGYVGEALTGTVETIWDGVMVPVNGVIDTAQGAVEVVEWAWNGLLDLIS